MLKDLSTKIVLLSGPRQCGKTTCAKALHQSYDYLNYDSSNDRLLIKKQHWDRDKKLIIFDELHKMPQWKRWIKGVYDTEGIPPQLLITGSAQLDTHRRVGDSLAGRYFQFRLHPIDLQEAVQSWKNNANEAFERLWNVGGFPEPFLKGDPEFYSRWHRTHNDVIVRQDLLDLYAIRNLPAIETLIALLQERVGMTISYANLARDLECDSNTVKRWLQVLESLYIIFRVKPYSKKIARSILKEPKFYFYDFAVIKNEGAKLENMVACALLKKLHYVEDTTGIATGLHYLRTKQGHEIDFLITRDNLPTHLIEVKMSNDEPSKSFSHFSSFIKNTMNVQLVKNITRNKSTRENLYIQSLIPWLEKMEI
ncbi:MAG: ATPase [Gammaproteobacteria bacterium RIFCSPLOWO2_02_FULL_42_14]|nr:MAG: ATPase [Gammaproteobacteria bacterium RIFCSPHIGHO2_02_FULL_42_43]OGT28468.1 MAG: ATPase [Gammaproteobacteria bacterium RIFCSPHIGHO2_01_FULL_42_8]OGT52785.1 MAG: ATPase [Gammaproteobacteria bacterium RIFCSPHIGHO2_12_FULL_41_25]OGT63322.1 MAG: ATPase [Gammaproteobacteria bacterium RIFCSPLOWO2_02_FULL_42_14]OGT86909.1 MAG: ATPase [Gammaproteobacteria bacterium RIFCSPLOWO2_12_FULL_42_18]